MVNEMTHNDIEILTTRLVLRCARMEDAENITRAKQDVWGELQQWMSWAYDGEESLASTQDYIESCAKNGSLPLLAFCRESGQLVLSTGLMKREDRYETGYWVTRDFLGKGLATEGTAATIDFAFDTLGAEAIDIGHYEGNDKSHRIIEKLGFTKMRVLEKNHARCSDGVLLDEHLYELTREQWRQRCR